MSDSDTRSVLFVCLGNICRSATGEGVLQHLVDTEGLAEQIKVDSAGTIGYHSGNPADARMRAAAQKRGFDLTSRSRQITVSDLETFDLVIAMDCENFEDIQRLHDQPTAKIKNASRRSCGEVRIYQAEIAAAR